MRAILLSATLGAALVAASLSSCVGAGGTACDGACGCPSQAVFSLTAADGGTVPAGASVSAYLERRCGTLDCHGSVGRPLRIYGQLGLRDPAGTDFSGGKTTTPAELADNYSAVCTLQPEQMSAVAQGIADPEAVLLLEKARGIEAHKGGQVFDQGSPADDCVAGWLRGDDPGMVAQSCQTAIAGL
jgi:hypothetical protein